MQGFMTADELMIALSELRLNKEKIESEKKEALNLLNNVISHADDTDVPAYMKWITKNYVARMDKNAPYGIINDIVYARKLFSTLEENRENTVIVKAPRKDDDDIFWGKVTKNDDVFIIQDRLYINTDGVHYVPNDNLLKQHDLSIKISENIPYNSGYECTFGKDLSETIEMIVQQKKISNSLKKLS